MALLVVVLGSLAAAGALVAADAGLREARMGERMTRSHLAARAGLTLVTEELNAQRDALLMGADPDLTGVWTLETDAGGRRTVVRLLPLDEAGALVLSEATRPDISRMNAEMLGAWLDIDASRAEALRASLDEDPLGAAEDLVARLNEDAEPDESSSVERPLSVCVREADVTLGLSRETEAFAGEARLVDPAAAEGVASDDDALGGDLARVFASGESGSMDDASLVRRLRGVGVPVERWGAVLDRVSTTGGEPRVGRLDVNRASEEALALVPGIGADAAGAIVSARERLDAESRRSPAWVVEEGLVSGESFVDASGWLTGVSLQWRVRIEAGSLPPADMSEFRGIGGVIGGPRDAIEDLPLEFAVVLEAVIDLSSERPRLAYVGTRPPGYRVSEGEALGDESDRLVSSSASGAGGTGRR